LPAANLLIQKEIYFMQKKIVHISVSMLALTYAGLAWADESGQVRILIIGSKKARPPTSEITKSGVEKNSLKEADQVADVIYLADRFLGRVHSKAPA
jgi:hypothetical protein